MTHIKIDPSSKHSIFDQLVFETIKSILGGTFKVGEPYPSVRALAAELKIHPNTAHKAVQHLIKERWLLSVPGKGTVVAKPPEARSGDRQQLLNHEVEQLVVEARRVGASLAEVTASIEKHWKSLEHLKAVSNDH